MNKVKQLQKEFYEQANFKISERKIFDLAEEINQNRLPTLDELLRKYQRHCKAKYATIDGLYMSCREYAEQCKQCGYKVSHETVAKYAKKYGYLVEPEKMVKFRVDKA